jgi:hypothetical protein
MLTLGTDALAIEGPHGRAAGAITLAAIRARTRAPPPPARPHAAPPGGL